MEENIYIDANIFILAAIDETKIGLKAKSFLRSIINKNLKAFTSTLPFDELAYKVLKTRNKDDALEVISAFFNISNLSFINVKENIVWNAFELIKEYNLYPRDSIHAACAMSKEIKTIISEDKDFDKIKELKKLSLEKMKTIP